MLGLGRRRQGFGFGVSFLHPQAWGITFIHMRDLSLMWRKKGRGKKNKSVWLCDIKSEFGSQ